MQSLVNYIKGDELPSPTTPIEIAEGILWFRLPMPIALDHINIYLLEDNDGWVLIDTGDIIVHVFRPEVREFYQIEKMWTTMDQK